MFNYYSNVCSASATEWLSKRKKTVQNAICFLMIKRNNNETEARVEVSQNCWLIIWIPCIYLTWTYRERLELVWNTHTHTFFLPLAVSLVSCELSYHEGVTLMIMRLNVVFDIHFSPLTHACTHIVRFYVVVVVVWRKCKLMASTPFNWFVTNFHVDFHTNGIDVNAKKMPTTKSTAAATVTTSSGSSSSSHHIKHNERPAGILHTHSYACVHQTKWLVCK